MTYRPCVLIVGAGPAGMAAAVRASEAGARVTVIDDNPMVGGQIWRGETRKNEWFERFLKLNIDVVTGTSVVAADLPSKTVYTESFRDARRLSFDRLVIATGAREFFLPFPGWTLPGVTGVGALQAMVKSGLEIAGKRIVIGGSGPLLLAAAEYLQTQGARIRVIAEQASLATLSRFLFQLALAPDKLLQAASLRLRLRRVPYRFDCWVEAAEGEDRVAAVRLRSGDNAWVESCDYAAVAYGLEPNIELASLLGCQITDAGVEVNEMQQSSIEGVYCAGECAGVGGLSLASIEGEIAGYAAAGSNADARRLFPARARAKRFASDLETAFRLRPELMRLPNADTIICRCEDVCYEKLQHHTSSRSAKLHTRFGMGPCQGRVCGVAGKFLFGWQPDSIRLPLLPANIATLASGEISGQGGSVNE